MWFWFHWGWLFMIVPLVMMLVCVLMCIFGRRLCGGGWSRCCGHTHNENRS